FTPRRPTRWWPYCALGQPARSSLGLAPPATRARTVGYLSLEGLANLGHHSPRPALFPDGAHLRSYSARSQSEIRRIPDSGRIHRLLYAQSDLRNSPANLRDISCRFGR